MSGRFCDRIVVEVDDVSQLVRHDDHEVGEGLAFKVGLPNVEPPLLRMVEPVVFDGTYSKVRRAPPPWRRDAWTYGLSGKRAARRSWLAGRFRSVSNYTGTQHTINSP